MKGIRYVVDEKGNKTGVVLDLKQHGALWEDLYDSLTAIRRATEPRDSLATVRRRLERAGKLKARG